jgi:5-methylcytosine-specific restriction enzyme subunit McrC
MKHLIVTECFDSIHISDSNPKEGLTSSEADELSNYVAKNRLDEEGIIVSRSHLTFINYVGFIQLSTCSIEILPKVTGDNPIRSRRVLLRMLQCTGNLDIHESQISQLTVEKLHLYEILAYLMVGKLSSELLKGVYHSYRQECGELPLVRGKIEITRQLIRESAKLPGVNCIYDEFQVNNQLNQIFKAALQTILSRCTYSNTRKTALYCLSLLDEASDIPINNPVLDSIQFYRTNRRFQNSFNLAKLLLTHSSPVSTTGKTRNSFILFKMNDLFEAYIAYMVRNIRDRVTVKDRRYKLLIKEGKSQGVFQLEPDLFIESTVGKSMIVDTKWKMIRSNRTRHGVKREDFYQMYAYLTRYNEVQTVILLYPHHSEIVKHSGSCLESWHLEDQPSKRLQVFTVSYEDEVQAEAELRDILEVI